VPLSVGRVPLLPSLGLVSALVLLTQVGPTSLRAGAAALAAVSLLYLVTHAPRRRPAST
jgi:hypothetical protein